MGVQDDVIIHQDPRLITIIRSHSTRCSPPGAVVPVQERFGSSQPLVVFTLASLGRPECAAGSLMARPAVSVPARFGHRADESDASPH